MHKENNYEFCKRLLEVHKKDRRDFSLLPEENEFAFQKNVKIYIPENAGEVLLTAAKDFEDYLFTSMKLSASIDYDDGEKKENSVYLYVNSDIGKASERRGHRVSVNNEYVVIEGFDECGAAQGLYYLEDVMNLRSAPFLTIKTEERRVMFCPRMIMSGYGMNEYPDAYLAALAHHGFTAISLWIYGKNHSQKGYTNFTDISSRAKKYGFDIYVQSFVKHEIYPEGEEAQKFYDELYADLLREFPFIKGIRLIGEACKFKSRDPNYPKNFPDGFYPSSDWKLLVEMIGNSVRKVSPDIEVIVSTYNWGWTPIEDRLRLIRILPENTILSCPWDLYENYDMNGIEEMCADYSLRVVGPNKNFIAEAEEASKRGLAITATTNTGGKTWDFGAIPYTPAPYRWAERCEAVREAHDKYGLSGLFDAIHYGVYPSFISELTKWAFCEPRVDLQALIPKLLAMHFGNEARERVDSAMKLWSEALANMVPTNEDQYGALRVGPSIPIYAKLENMPEEQFPPQDQFAMHKFKGMFYSVYNANRHEQPTPWQTRVPEEIKTYEKVKDLIFDGIKILESIEEKNDELKRLIAMGYFMYRTTISCINRKKFFLLDKKRLAEESKEDLADTVSQMQALLNEEKENARETIPIVEYDSVLGFEPSMEYVCDRYRLEWKMSQVEREIERLSEFLNTKL